MNVQHIGRYKCDHVQVSQVQRKFHTPRKQTRSPTERNQLRRELPKRDLWCAVVCFYYFCANYANAYLYGMDFSANESSILLSVHDWKAYFFNASVIGLTCLCMIAFMPEQLTRLRRPTQSLSLSLSFYLHYHTMTLQLWSGGGLMT